MAYMSLSGNNTFILEAVNTKEEAPTALLEEEKTYLLNFVDKRCKLITGEAHGFAYLLDPRYLGESMEFTL